MSKPLVNLDFGLIDPSLPAPLYHQIYTRISDKIRLGDLPTGTIIPGEIQLAEAMNVSRITVKRALNELAKTGLVARQRGRGTVVIATTDLNFHDNMRDYIDNIDRLRKNTQGEILSRQTLAAPDYVAKKLNTTPGETVEKITHRLLIKKDVISYVETFLPRHLGANFTDSELSTTSILSLLSRDGVTIKRAEQRLFAVTATDEIAAIMEIEAGTPLLKIHCVMIDAADRPVEDIYAWYHSGRYQYQMTLTL